MNLTKFGLRMYQGWMELLLGIIHNIYCDYSASFFPFLQENQLQMKTNRISYLLLGFSNIQKSGNTGHRAPLSACMSGTVSQMCLWPKGQASQSWLLAFYSRRSLLFSLIKGFSPPLSVMQPDSPALSLTCTQKSSLCLLPGTSLHRPLTGCLCYKPL